MTPLGRACLGALLGALITLFAHPVSRPFLLSSTQRATNRQLQDCFDAAARPLPPPQNLKGASLWLQLASERLNHRGDLQPSELATELEIARRAGKLDPKNAFWIQEQAVLLNAAGQPKKALEAWTNASHCETWNDLQTARLFDAQAKMARTVGASQAWQFAYAYINRSEAPAAQIERYGRNLLAQSNLDGPDGLLTRYITLVNGELLRLGSRSVTTGVLGANLEELSAYPRDLMKTPSPKRLWVAQSKFMNMLTAAGMTDFARKARIFFSRVESWRALILSQDPPNRFNDLSAGSVISGTMIGACAFASVIGGVLWILGWQVSRRLGNTNRLSLYIVVPFALFLGGISAWLTHDLWAGLVSLLAGGFLYMAPANSRKARPEDIGPLFSFLFVVIAVLCGGAVGAFAIGRTPGAKALLPRLGVATDFYSTPLLLGMAFLFFALALVAVPIWARVQRLGTPHIFGLALRKLGAYLGFGGLAVGILFGPVAVYADIRIGQTLTKLIGNEPVYYLARP